MPASPDCSRNGAHDTLARRARAGCLALGLALALSLGVLPSTDTQGAEAPVSGAWPGPATDGSVLLPNQWSLRPAGQALEVGDFPVNIAIHPGGRFAAVLHCGYGQHEIAILEIDPWRVATRVDVAEAFYGLEFAPAGDRLYCSGASSEVVRVFAFAQGRLTDLESLRTRPVKERGIPAGLAVSPDGRGLFVADLWGQGVKRIELATPQVVRELNFVPGIAGATFPEATLATNLDVAAIAKRALATLDPAGPDAVFPYACRLDATRDRLYVSLWGQARVAVLQASSLRQIDSWPTQEHPNEMVLTRSGRHLFVANANRNTVTVLDTASGRAVETLGSSLTPNAPPGSTPNSLALTPDDRRLFVANACNNAVAVFDVTRPGRSRSLGFIPTGWFPTSVRITPDGRRLLVASGKGGGSKANPAGPTPGRSRAPGSLEEYIGGLFRGTVSRIDLPSGRDRARQWAAWTRQALAGVPGAARPNPAPARAARGPVPARAGEPSPIRYCIYILKENRTYDQVLGDLERGNGDPALCLFPENLTPNHHRLAREFVLLDNFYVDGEVSADGHEWSMGAYANDFVEKMWPLSYGHNGRGKYPYPSEGNFPIARPAGGYLWDQARAAGVSYRSYGEFINNAKTPDRPATSRVKALEGHFDPWFRSFDMDYSDLKRADRFIAELNRFEAEGDMPRLQIVRLPNDHTAGTTAGKLTPRAYVAQNDAALGRVIEAISRSRFWPRTAVFVVEDDAQNGADHVDAHRTVAFAISPYARHHAVDSTLYSTTSMLRTMELILGLQPMSQFDAAAQPMHAAFQAAPDLQPYTAAPVQADLEERNLATAWGAQKSSRMDFSREDAADDLQLNEVVWRSVRGPDSPMPAPRRAAFVWTRPGKRHDDD